MEKSFLIFLIFALPLFADTKSGDAALDRAIAKANSDWASAMKTGNVSSISAAYADDAVFVGLDGTCIKGRLEIEKMYRDRFATGGVAASTKIEPRKVTIDGDLAYESGYAEIVITKASRASVNAGAYLTVWQKKNGEWKIFRNVVLP